jgi:HEAT repeat protein
VDIEVLQVELDEARQVVQDALELQRVEIGDGFSSANRALYRLVTEMDRSVTHHVIADLRIGQKERQLAARILIESPHGCEAVLDEVEDALSDETEPEVIGWLVTALGYTRDQRSLPVLKVLSTHPSSTVRFQVPEAVSMCAEGGFEPVYQTLLGLSFDADLEVRWSAVFELGAWLRETKDERIVTRLSEAAIDDPAEAVRATASDALDEGGIESD